MDENEFQLLVIFFSEKPPTFNFNGRKAFVSLCFTLGKCGLFPVLQFLKENKIKNDKRTIWHRFFSIHFELKKKE